jgi:DNA (cytosine-5)-methyltransferase 1
MTINDAVKMWPTPTSISPAKNGYNEAGNSCGLVAIRKRISDEDSQATGQLNPMWVEWLMGFPLGWTDLEGSETQ